MKCIKPSGIRKFFDLAATMEGVISLGVGEPDFVTAWNFVIVSAFKDFAVMLIFFQDEVRCRGNDRLKGGQLNGNEDFLFI
jgi:hypothetical protein